MTVIDPFNKGDFIAVTPLQRDLGTFKDWGVIRGTALNNVSRSGSSVFNLRPDPAICTLDNRELTLRFNANEVDVRLLFSATVARESN